MQKQRKKKITAFISLYVPTKVRRHAIGFSAGEDSTLVSMETFVKIESLCLPLRVAFRVQVVTTKSRKNKNALDCLHCLNTDNCTLGDINERKWPQNSKELGCDARPSVGFDLRPVA